jgi:mannose-6-phosphate isomerase-like protein (cupin superfamily)
MPRAQRGHNLMHHTDGTVPPVLHRCIEDHTMTAVLSDVVAPTTTAPARPAVPFVIPAGWGETVRAFGNQILFKLGTADTAGAFSLGLATVSATDSVVPPHVHEGEDELFIIVEGEYRFFVGGTWSDAGPGSVVYLPAGAMHTFHVVGERDGKHWVLNTSPRFRDYYTRAGALFASGFPDPARLGALGAEYGMYVIRPDAALAQALAAR